MKYFKLIHKKSDTIMCIVHHDDDETVGDAIGGVLENIREIYGPDEYEAVCIPKEEYDLMMKILEEDEKND